MERILQIISSAVHHAWKLGNE